MEDGWSLGLNESGKYNSASPVTKDWELAVTANESWAIYNGKKQNCQRISNFLPVPRQRKA